MIKFQYYKSTLQTTFGLAQRTSLKKFQYYKSTLQTNNGPNLSTIRTKISILQKYSSNTKYPLAIPPAQASFQYYKSTLQTWRRLIWSLSGGLNFNTTKVLFKPSQVAQNLRVIYKFQYYKSTLQTGVSARQGRLALWFQYYKSTLQTRTEGLQKVTDETISILQKYSSNWTYSFSPPNDGNRISILQKYSSNLR